jgi:transcriptional regulator with XRE-family HTH domain
VNNFSEKLANLRSEQSTTSKEVAQKVGIPQSRLIELESGVRIPTAGQLERLESYYRLVAGELSALV